MTCTSKTAFVHISDPQSVSQTRVIGGEEALPPTLQQSQARPVWHSERLPSPTFRGHLPVSAKQDCPVGVMVLI